MTNHELDELRREADQRRDAISRDVDLMTDRVAPGRIADRQKAKFTQRVTSVRSRVFGTPDDDRGLNRGTTTDPSGFGDQTDDTTGGTVDRVKQAAPDSVTDFTEGNPLAAGLIGLGVGLLAASLIPETREEQRVASRVQDNVDSAAAEIARSGKEAAENVKPAAQDAAENVKAAAQDSATNVKSDAQSAAEDVRDTAKSEAQTARK